MSSSSVQASGTSVSTGSLVMAFVAGALAVPVFHQIMVLILHAAGVIPFGAFSFAPTKPFGVPDVISISFWGGVWGVVFQLTLPRWFSGVAYWVAAIVAGGVALTLVFMFVVFPVKFGGMVPAAQMVPFFIIGFVLNAAWGFGWALFLALSRKLRPS